MNLYEVYMWHHVWIICADNIESAIRLVANNLISEGHTLEWGFDPEVKEIHESDNTILVQYDLEQ